MAEIEKLRLEYAERFSEIDGRIEKLIESQERCTNAIERLTEDTEGVIELYKNAQSLITVGMAVQRLGLWIVKWPIIGAGCMAIWHWAQKHIQ